MDKSYWLNNANKMPKYPKLEGEKKVEIAIIGAGLSGLTTAYYLTKANREVYVVEKNRICCNTSGNTTAKITSQHGLFYSYLLQSVGKTEALQYLKANEEAIQNIEKIIKDENIECDFEKQNAYVFTQSKTEVKKLKREVEALKYLGFNCEFLENIEVPIKEKKINGAIKFENQAQFNPYLYAHGLANKIENNGGKIFENSKVIDIKKRNNFYEVITEDAKILAKYVVIATHYPIINMPGFYFMKMYQETSYLIAVETNEKLFEGMYISSEEPTISFRTAKYKNKRLLIVGGMSHKTGAKIDLKNSYKKLEDIAKQIYPDSKILYCWNTQDTITLDKIPYIGEFSNLWPNVYVETGYKKWGMTSSNVAANIVADKILKRENKYEKVFKSTRLKPIKNHEELFNMLKEISYSEVINKLEKIDEYIKNVKQGEGKIVEVEGKKVGVYRNEDGKIYMVKPYCTHLGCELSWNNLDKTWDCPCHGSRFTYEGNLICDPAIKDLEKFN